jgi:hypothetical protein
MLSRIDPSARMSTSSVVIARLNFSVRGELGLPYGARPISLYSPLFTVKPQ